MLGLSVVALLASQIIQRWWLPDGSQFNVMHVGLAATVVALAFMQRERGRLKWIVGIAALAIIAAAMVYFYPEAAVRMGRRTGFATNTDLIFGILLLALIFFFTWRAWGPIFPVLGLLAIGYAFVGPYVPEPLTGPRMDPQRVLSRVVLNSTFGGLVGQFASYIWFIIFWGLLLEVAGARLLIARVARALASRIPGGPAHVTVFSSGVVGSFLGGGATDVAITGPITIPMMKRAGYSAPLAAAIEAAASSGAALSPPILGTVAFIMADQLGTSYAAIMLMTLVPTLLWYTSNFSYVVAKTGQLGIRRTDAATEPVLEDDVASASTRRVLAATATILIPVTVLTALLIFDSEVYNAVFYAFIALVACVVLLRAERRPAVWHRGVVHAATMASAVTLVIVIVAIMSDMLTLTGLGSRMGDVVYKLSGGHLLTATLFVVATGIIMAAGMPALVIYFVMVITFQPVFTRFGIPIEAVHFVAFYAGILNQIVLPVASSVLVAATIAGASYWRSGVEAFKMTIPILTMPFIIISAPEILLGVGDKELPLVIASVLASNVVVSFGMGGWLGRPLGLAQRALLVAIGGIAYVGVFIGSDGVLWLGLIACLGASGVGFGLARLARRRMLAPLEQPALAE
jgi:TRAP transporter 4TM/12TM fusion protein